MVKLVVLPVLVVLLAMHTPINAYGLVRVDIQKDNSGIALANAIGNAISSKLQSWNNILNSLIQVKYSYGGSGSAGSSTSSTSGTGGYNLAPFYQKVIRVNSGTAAVAPSSSAGSSTSSTSGTGGLNLAPLYQKVIRVNSGTAAAAPSSGRVAERIDGDDDDHESSPSSSSIQGSAAAGGQTLVTVNKSLGGVSVSSSPVAAGSASASLVASASAPNTVGYSYRKRYIQNIN